MANNTAEITLEDIMRMKADANANNASTKERKPCSLYLNIGVEKPLIVTRQDENGNISKEETTQKITLPYNVDLINMPLRKVPNKDGIFKKIIVSSNELLNTLREKGKTMKDGESIPLKLTVWLTKVSVAEPETTSEDNLLDKDDIF